MTEETVSVLFCGIHDLGWKIYDWLTEREGADVLGLITEKEQLNRIHELNPDLVVSVGFRHKISPEFLSVPDLGVINVHGSYLPYNRGANSDVWAIIGDDPAGVTIHYMVEKIDAGPIIAQRKVKVYPDDNAKTVTDRHNTVGFELFKDVWPAIRRDEVSAREQDHDVATVHLKSDFVDLWELDLDKRVRCGDLIDKLRALTHPPYKNAYFTKDGNKYYVEIESTDENKIERTQGDHAEEYEQMDDSSD
jgi:methionyl-tRNA formyltransferase